ncbi:glycosyltransferase family 4 protein [Methylobacterium planeticum]|uniref:Glycosyltransferase family 4 protein n=1 Tax=Methylobacterium planeticum TaxID=2615211 RepID=A0A6N6MXL5_9HYPH|nr:glycosyltransferase family 4 protein [Methylobacterium planeticum]KAB1075988.1 glycosyltransferase family 4 protein [Methylobacterium planeticum]
MKILLPTLYDTHGGSTRVLLAAAAALRADHAVTVRAPLVEADERVRAFFPSRPLVGLARKLAVLPRLAALVRAEAAALRRLRPDLVYVHDEPALYVYGLAAAALRPRPRLLWHLHAGAGTGLTARLRARLADGCIVISPHVAPPPGLPSRLIRNPLPLPPAAAPPRTGLAGLAVVGAVVPRKGQDLAVEALACLRGRAGGAGAHLTLIGPELDPAFAARLRARIAELGLEAAVTFAGERPPETAFAGVSAALFPSQAETQPLALAEALARGLPVALTDIPAHRAMLAEAGADLAALAPRDPGALAEALLRAVARAADPNPPDRIRSLYDPARFAAELRGHIAHLARDMAAATRL